MAVDPNVYALSIQLQFDASEAFTTLDDFGQKVSDLEEELSSAAQKAIQGLGQIAQEASKSLTDIGKQLIEIDANTLKIQTNLSEATKELKDQFDNGEDRLENIEEEFEFQEKMVELSEELGKELKHHLELNDEFLSLTGKIIQAVMRKNVGHGEQNDLLRTDRDLISAANKGLGEMESNTKKNKDATEKLVIGWRQVWGWIKKADEDTEKFTTTNYRHYGSQQQLVQGARELAMANGIAYEQAVEAYAVMGNLKVPKEELDKYAKAVAQANRTTGVGIQATGEYVNRLRTAGLSIAGTERQLAFMGEAMRKFGLNTRDVNALMNQSAANAKNAARIFGGGAAELAKWEESRVILAGFAREAGHSADELAGFENWILNDVAALEQFKAMTNTTEKGIDGYRLAMLRAGIAANKQMEAIEAGVANGTRSQAELLAIQQSIIDTQFGGNRAAFEAARAQGKLATQNGLTGKSIEDVNRVTEIYANTLANQQAEANNTFTAQMRILWSTITAAMNSVLQFIADALLPLIKALNWLIGIIAKVVGWVADFVRWMEKIPVVGKVITFLKWAIGIVMALGLAFIFVSGAVISFSAVLGGFGGLMARMTAGVQAFANIILILVRALGQAIVIILSSIGQGLQALGNSIKSVIVPLMALGLALMLAGIGAYFFAMGVRIVAEMGWAAIPALLGMIIAIALLGLVLIGLAMLVQGPVALGLIILAVAILAVGIAAFLMGVGIFMAAQGFQILAEVLTFGLIAKFFVLGLAIVALGALALMAIPGLYALAIVMVIIAVAAILIAVAFYIVAAAIQMIGTEAIPALAQGFMMGALYMVAAAALLIVAAALFIVAAILLGVAVAYMLPVAPSLITIGISLLIGGVLLAVGAALLFAAGIMILIGGLGILIGGVGLYVGLLLLGMSTPLMFGIGLGLVIGSTLMKAGAAALMTTGIMILVAGVTLFIGAYLMLKAAEMMVAAVPLFMQVGGGYVIAGAQILTGSLFMMVGGAMMAIAGVFLAAGGIALIVAGIMLAIGLAFLSDSSQEVYDIGMRIGIGGLMMLAGASALVTAASMLGDSADHIDRSLDILKGLMPKVMEAALAMMPAGMMLRVAALQLALGCIYINIAGNALKDGVFPLIIGAMFLDVAVKILVALAPAMQASAGQILSAAGMLLQAASVLVPASMMMAIAGILLATGVTLLLYGGRLMFLAGISLLIGSIIMLPAATILHAAMTLLLPAAEMAVIAGQVLFDAAIILAVASIVLVVAAFALGKAAFVILYSSRIFIAAMMVIWVGSMFLGMAAKNIFNSAIMLAIAGSLLPTAAVNILVGMVVLAAAADAAWAASDGLITGSMVLAWAAEEIMWATMLLTMAGDRLRPASWAIYSGLMWMEFAVSRFSKTIDKVEQVAGAMSTLAGAFAVLHATPIRGLRDMADEALGAVPNITKLGEGLSAAAQKLDEGVRAFEGPAERLNGILSRLTETITAFGQGLNLTDDVSKLADMLDNYANLLENASARIETAVVTKAVPAMRAAEEAGIEETVRTEAITTVQVANRSDGAAREAQDESTKLLTKVSETLTTIKDTMVEMQSGGKGELTEIVAILQAYLPGLNKGDAGLGSEFNSWAK